MPNTTDRRRCLITLGTAAAGIATGVRAAAAVAADAAATPKISLAQWSLHRTLRDESSGVTTLDFPRIAREDFGIGAVEYVNQFFMERAEDDAYLNDLKRRCDDQGVNSLLIMVDREGNLGDPDDDGRTRAIDNHRKWIDAAKKLGCHSIRVNARSGGTFQEQQRLAADGLSRLSEIAAESGLNVLVENHGGWSSHGEWLAGVMRMVDRDNCGTLPDFGNFFLRRGNDPMEYDRYQGVRDLMPFAKAVSAKTHDFDDDGNEVHTDYNRMMGIVREAGYEGFYGIEYEGNDPDEYAGIRRTRDLLRRYL